MARVSPIAIDSIAFLATLHHDDAVVVSEVLEKVAEDVGFDQPDFAILSFLGLTGSLVDGATSAD